MYTTVSAAMARRRLAGIPNAPAREAPSITTRGGPVRVAKRASVTAGGGGAVGVVKDATAKPGADGRRVVGKEEK